MVLAFIQVTTMDSLKNKINEVEKEEILKALKECDWIMAKAAKKLGITERMIGYKVKKYGLRTKEVRWVEESHQSDNNQK